MSIELKSKRLDDLHTVYYDADTSDPIATVRRTPYGNKKRYNAKWHPQFHLMYPNAHDLSNMNFEHLFSEADLKSHIARKYSEVMGGKADPLKTKLVGTATRQITPAWADQPQDKEFNHYHVFDEDKNHVASMYVQRDLEDRIGQYPGAFSKGNVQIEYHIKAPNSVQEDALRKKYPLHDPIAALNRVKDWLASAGKDPSFVGSHSHNTNHSSSIVKHYTTNLSPEDASKKFEEHLRGDERYANATFTRHSPMMFSINRPVSEYGVGFHKEFVDTTAPNTVMHSRIPMFDKSFKSDELNEVID